MPESTSELAWQLADYQAAGMEPPRRLAANPDLTEGEVMTDEEVEAYITDSIATLRILADRQSDRYDAIYECYCSDLKYLTSLGRMSEDDYNELTSLDNLRF
ncbi:MAG TPA: hypothetical protein VGH44_05225 [Candidatus Saccharimonadia bacterium]|jgi:hypothetical protein